MQLLQQATLNSINSFDGAKKAAFATWAQCVENAARICNLDAINITLSKVQGALLKSAIYLEGKETSAGKKLSWNTLKQCAMQNITDHTTNKLVALPIIQCVNACQFSCPFKQLQQ